MPVVPKVRCKDGPVGSTHFLSLAVGKPWICRARSLGSRELVRGRERERERERERGLEADAGLGGIYDLVQGSQTDNLKLQT